MTIKTNSDEFQSYLTDASNFKGNSNKLYIPQNQAELQEAIIDCYNNKTQFTISGAGTGTTGGRVPLSGAIISTEMLTKIIEFDEQNNSITVESGILLSEINEFLSNTNCFYPPNPTESNSSIGGNIATNASGSRSFKYGATRNFIQELKIILPNGQELYLTRNQKAIDNKYVVQSEEGTIYQFDIPEIYYPNTKNSTGYYLKKDMDLIDLFIGNEGTLGVIASAKLKLISKPESIIGAFVFFENFANMIKFVDYIRGESKDNFKINSSENIAFRLIEYFDNNSLEFIRKNAINIPENAICGIWFEQEYEHHQEENFLELIYTTISKFTNLADETIIAITEKEHRNLYELRHALPLSVNEIIAKTKFRKIGTDTAVPVHNFEEYFYFLKSEAENSGLNFIIFGHIGDCHLHCNFFPTNEKEFDLALLIYERIIKKTLEFQGSVSAEHGIGKIKKQYFKNMVGADKISEYEKIKQLFDEKNLCGIGNLF